MMVWIGILSFIFTAACFAEPAMAQSAWDQESEGGDYDGDRKADPAIYQYSSGQWLILQSARSYSPAVVTFFGN